MLLTQTRGRHNDPEKFPAVQLALLALVRLAEPIALTSIFPYAWKLVLSFQVGDESNASFYAGLLISAFALAESLTGMYWGDLSDRIGRRPVLFIGCMGTIASLLTVGLSSSFSLALFGRLIGGALNGNIGVIQTMVSELVTDPRHEPKAYAIMPFVWTIGTIIGPCIGGYFAEPAVNFPNTFAADGIFGRFPYLLPNLLCAGLMLVSVFLGWMLLEETCDRQTTQGDAEAQQLLSEDSTALIAHVGMAQDSYGTFTAPADHSAGALRSSIGTNDKVLTRRVVMLIVALGIFTYHSMTFDHLLPIFLQDRKSTSAQLSVLFATKLDPLAGGLGMTTQQTGIVMAVQGAIALFIQAAIFPLMAEWLGIWPLFVGVTIAHPLTYIVMPGLALLPEQWVSLGLYACLTLRNLLSILAYPLLLILIKEAAPSRSCLGRINGLAASTGAGCRTIASPVAGYLYGLGMSIGLTAIAWWASALVAAIGSLQLLAIIRCTPEDSTSTDDVVRNDTYSKHNAFVVTVNGLDSGYNTDEEVDFAAVR